MSQNLIAANNLNPQVLVSEQIAAANTETTVYQVAAAASVTVATAWLCNTTASAVTVSVSVCQSGQTAGATNRVVDAYPLAANDTLSLTPYLGGALMGPGDFVSVNVGTAAAVNFGATGAVGS